MEQRRDLGAVLVAGGGGWVGSFLVRALEQRSVELGVTRVVVADPRVQQRRPDSAGIPVEDLPVDISDSEGVEALFLSARPDTVVNLAAVIDVRPEGDAARLDAVNNLGAGILLDAASRHRAKAFIHVSTLDAAWTQRPMVLHAPDPPGDLQTESAIAYVRSKARGEARAHAAAAGGDRLSVVVLRPAHIFGDLSRGDPLAHYIRTTPPLRIGDPAVRMSMVCVSRVVEAILRVAVRSEALHGRTYALKDVDANFFQFYQERILGRCCWPLIRIPAGLALLAAHAADMWFRAVAAARCVCCKRSAGGDSPGTLRSALLHWARPLLERHPMKCIAADGLRQALVNLTVDDSTTRRDLGSF